MADNADKFYEESVHLEMVLRFKVDRPFTKQYIKKLVDLIWATLWWQADNTTEGLCPCDGHATRIKIMYEGKEI